MHPTLGPRICIIGPSSCGKSTLADRLGKAYGLNIVHLDKLYHQPYGNWIPRPKEEFLELHDAAIADELWVMEGNYTKLMPQRFDRATAIIRIEMNRFGAVWRFLKRHYQNKNGVKRIGQPDDVEEKFNWSMVWWILQPKSLIPGRRSGVDSRKALFDQHRDKITTIRSFKQMEQFF